MKGTRAALRYAKAILAYAQENNSSGAVAKDMHKLAALLGENDALQAALENPLLAVEKKLNVVKALFPKASESSVKLFSLLADNNRLSILGETGKQYLDLYTKNQGEVKAIVTSAVPLSSALEKEVLEKAKNFSQQKVHIENKIDPNIMGGFILKIGDMQYDASVVHQLKAIKTTLTKTNTI